MSEVTRISSPAVLMTFDDELGRASTITNPAKYHEYHGYLPIPYCDYSALFKQFFPVEILELVDDIGIVGAFLLEDGAFEVRINLSTPKGIPSDLFPQIQAIATEMFHGPLGEDIASSSGGVTGTSIICIPVGIRVTSLGVPDLLAELRDSLAILHANRDFPNLSVRSGIYHAVYWVAETLELVLPPDDARRIKSMMDAISGCELRKSTVEEIEISAQLLDHFKI